MQQKIKLQRNTTWAEISVFLLMIFGFVAAHLWVLADFLIFLVYVAVFFLTYIFQTLAPAKIPIPTEFRVHRSRR